MRRMAHIDERDGQLIVSSWWPCGERPVFVPGNWAQAAGEPVSDEALGAMVRSALAACRETTPRMLPWDSAAVRRRYARLHKLAGARFHRSYVRGLRHVSVYWDDSEPAMGLTPTCADGRGGFRGIKGTESRVSAGASNAGFGAAVRAAIAACGSASRPPE
jgi:hypothetical protein